MSGQEALKNHPYACHTSFEVFCVGTACTSSILHLLVWLCLLRRSLWLCVSVTSSPPARLRGSKDGLAAQVLQDLVVEGSVVQRPGVAPCTLMVPGRVRPTEVPQHCPQAYVQHQEVGKGLYGDFSALQPQPYQVCTVCTAVKQVMAD